MTALEIGVKAPSFTATAVGGEYGKKYMGTERSTFVIGPDGRIATILRKVKPAEHAQKLFAVD